MVFYAWMTNKSQKAYMEILDRIEQLAGNKIRLTAMVTDQEQVRDEFVTSFDTNFQFPIPKKAQYQAVDRRFEVVEIFRCAFHISQKWKILFEKNLKPYLTPRRQHATDPDRVIVNHCRKGQFNLNSFISIKYTKSNLNLCQASRLFMYLPTGFAVAYAQYLIGLTSQIQDDYAETHLHEVMVAIRNDLMKDQSISWYRPLIQANCWVDVTSNKERLN